MEQNETLADKVKKKLTRHLVDTTALLACSNPVYAAMEVNVAGMSEQASINSRLTAAGLSYLVMGAVFASGREFSKKLFNITDQTKEQAQAVHDAAYAAAFNLTIAPAIYLLAGAESKQAIIGGFSAAGLSLVLGPLLGYSVDVARDLTGLNSCERALYPEAIKRQKPSVKKGLAGLLVVGSLAAMAGIYSLTPNEPESPNPIPTSERHSVKTTS